MGSDKWMKIIVLIVKIALAVLFILAGSGKFQSESIMANNFVKWGLGLPVMYLVGIGEILGGILLFFRRTFFYGITILTIIMLGAAIIHLLHFEEMGVPLLNIILLMVIGMLFLNFNKQTKK